jgi:hypothetical protein
MATGPVPDTASVGGVRDDVERSAVATGGRKRRCDLDLEHAFNDLAEGAALRDSRVLS